MKSTAFKLCLIFSISIFSSLLQARSRLGGYMGNCYNGSFRVNEICASSNSSADSWLGSYKLRVNANAFASYLNSGGEAVNIKVNMVIEDFSNYLNPESSLPVIVRFIVGTFHRDPMQYSVSSRSIVVKRRYGQRVFESEPLELVLRNKWGAEYVETLEKIEVLVPGFPSVLVLQF